jgi:aldehyde:ferredoxin oxidoreductase
MGTFMTEERPGAYAGKILRVDLASGRIWTEAPDADWLRRWVGGVGFGAKILYDEVPPEVNWDDPENRLILATGPLAGTPIWGTGTLAVVTRGAMTNGATSTQANGFFGACLKYSGYDAIVLQGRAPAWKYLYIRDDQVELCDAADLLGMDTWETQDLLQARYGLGGHNLSVYAIGPAGENLVRFAAIEGDYGHVASKNGCGAVMGSKRLKAVAIGRGTQPIRVPDPVGAFAIADEIAGELQNDPTNRTLYTYGTLVGVVALQGMGALPLKNYTTNLYPESDAQFKGWEAPAMRARWPEHRGYQCNACGMHHCHQLRVPDGPHRGEIVDEPEYEGLSGAGTTLGVTDPVAAAWLNTQVDRACVDVNEFGWVIGWVMECLEKGYLTPAQVGLDLKWGDVEGANRLLQMINRREGFGDLLAEGVKRAAEAIGGPAAECAIYTQKGAQPRGHDHRAIWFEMLDTCVGSTGTLEVGNPVRPTEIAGVPARTSPFDPVEVPTVLGKLLGRRHIEDSLGICIFTTKTTIAQLARAYSAVSGFHWTFDDALQFGRRVAAVLRAFNIRCGIGPELERPSARYGSTPVDGPAAGLSIAPHWDAMRRRYYAEVGFDWETGKPTVELLRRLDLEALIPDVWGTEVARA